MVDVTGARKPGNVNLKVVGSVYDVACVTKLTIMLQGLRIWCVCREGAKKAMDTGLGTYCHS